jgi:hypothetical protein
MKTGKTFWTKVNSRKEIKTSVALPVIVQNPDPIWNRPFTINALAVTQNTRKKRRRQAPGTVGNVMSKNNYLKN